MGQQTLPVPRDKTLQIPELGFRQSGRPPGQKLDRLVKG